MPHALDTSLWATVTYLYTGVENPPANKIRLNELVVDKKDVNHVI